MLKVNKVPCCKARVMTKSCGNRHQKNLRHACPSQLATYLLVGFANGANRRIGEFQERANDGQASFINRWGSSRAHAQHENHTSQQPARDSRLAQLQLSKCEKRMRLTTQLLQSTPARAPPRCWTQCHSFWRRCTAINGDQRPAQIAASNQCVGLSNQHTKLQT